MTIHISAALNSTSKCISVRICGEEETDMALITMGDFLTPGALESRTFNFDQPYFGSSSPYISESHTDKRPVNLERTQLSGGSDSARNECKTFHSPNR